MNIFGINITGCNDVTFNNETRVYANPEAERKMEEREEAKWDLFRARFLDLFSGPDDMSPGD